MATTLQTDQPIWKISETTMRIPPIRKIRTLSHARKFLMTEAHQLVWTVGVGFDRTQARLCRESLGIVGEECMRIQGIYLSKKDKYEEMCKMSRKDRTPGEPTPDGPPIVPVVRFGMSEDSLRGNTELPPIDGNSPGGGGENLQPPPPRCYCVRCGTRVENGMIRCRLCRDYALGLEA